jgi:hypothetical protein
MVHDHAIMTMRSLSAALLLSATLLTPAALRADSVRFRFVPTGPQGALVQVPAGPDGALGELRAGLSTTPRPFPRNYRPNRLVTFRHPYTSRNVTLPMMLPDNTPRIEHIRDRIRFGYTSYFIDVRFLPDGGVDVVYNSGFLRTLPQ